MARRDIELAIYVWLGSIIGVVGMVAVIGLAAELPSVGQHVGQAIQHVTGQTGQPVESPLAAPAEPEQETASIGEGTPISLESAPASIPLVSPDRASSDRPLDSLPPATVQPGLSSDEGANGSEPGAGESENTQETQVPADHAPAPVPTPPPVRSLPVSTSVQHVSAIPAAHPRSQPTQTRAGEDEAPTPAAPAAPREQSQPAPAAATARASPVSTPVPAKATTIPPQPQPTPAPITPQRTPAPRAATPIPPPHRVSPTPLPARVGAPQRTPAAGRPPTPSPSTRRGDDSRIEREAREPGREGDADGHRR